MEEIDLKKRFWVFDIDRYYPQGGLCDISQTFDTLDEARKFAKSYWDVERVIELFDAEERIQVDI